ncbi:hypothetical protein L0244_27890 [bacterium]|nr:hypothetical protein [bacterium]
MTTVFAGVAKDPVAAAFGCPDRIGMMDLSGGYKTFCYWIKRPIGQIGALAAIGAIVFFVFKK